MYEIYKVRSNNLMFVCNAVVEKTAIERAVAVSCVQKIPVEIHFRNKVILIANGNKVTDMRRRARRVR